MTAPARDLTIAQWLRVHVERDAEYQEAAKRVRKWAFRHFREKEKETK